MHSTGLSASSERVLFHRCGKVLFLEEPFDLPKRFRAYLFRLPFPSFSLPENRLQPRQLRAIEELNIVAAQRN